MSKKIDNLTNKKFGRLIVKTYAGVVFFGKTRQSGWYCKCSCGNECLVNHHNLMRGGTRSCGCLRKELASKNLISKQFGNLIVLEKHGFASNKTNTDRQVLWKCKCVCGNTHIAKTSLLLNGKVKSCGCLIGKKCEDLKGRQFGELIVLNFHQRKNLRTFWWCKCGCGKVKSLDAHHLKSGNQKSCGCRSRGWKHGLSKDAKAYYRYLMSNPMRKLRHRVGVQVRKAIGKYGGCKSKASITKYLPYTMSELKNHLEKLWEPWMNWNNYGGKSNESQKTWWIDHIIPHSRFPYNNMEDPLFLQCWDLSNLRPMEKISNIKKGAR